jgi:hypothetical protein
MTDFPKENEWLRQTLINSDGLRNSFVTIEGERGTIICCQVFLDERMEIEKDPSGADGNTRKRYIRAVSDQNPVADVQNRMSFML